MNRRIAVAAVGGGWMGDLHGQRAGADTRYEEVPPKPDRPEASIPNPVLAFAAPGPAWRGGGRA